MSVMYLLALEEGCFSDFRWRPLALYATEAEAEEAARPLREAVAAGDAEIAAAWKAASAESRPDDWDLYDEWHDRTYEPVRAAEEKHTAILAGLGVEGCRPDVYTVIKVYEVPATGWPANMVGRGADQ